MVIDFNLIIAITAVISSLIAIYAIIQENKRSNFSLSMDLLFKINDQFSHPDFRRKRKAAARFIVELKDRTVYANWINSDVDEILDFFEVIANLTERGALDKEIIWQQYYYWVNHYYSITKKYIELNKNVFPETWEGVEWLYNEFVRLENKRTRGGYSPPSQRAIRQFLLDESNLRVDKE